MNLKHIHFSAEQIKGFLVVRGHRDLLENKYKEGKLKHNKPFDYARNLTDQAIRKGYIKKKTHNEMASMPRSQETSTSSNEDEEILIPKKRKRSARQSSSTVSKPNHDDSGEDDTESAHSESENETRSRKRKASEEATKSSDCSSTEPVVDTDMIMNHVQSGDENQDINKSTEELPTADTGQTEQQSANADLPGMSTCEKNEIEDIENNFEVDPDIDLPLIQIRPLEPEASEKNLEMKQVGDEHQETIVTEDTTLDLNENENGMNHVQHDEPNVTEETLQDVNENGLNHVQNDEQTVTEDTIQDVNENVLNHIQQNQESTEMQQNVESSSEMNHEGDTTKNVNPESTTEMQNNVESQEMNHEGDTTIEYINEKDVKQEEEKKITIDLKAENIDFIQCKAEKTERKDKVKNESTEQNIDVESQGEGDTTIDYVSEKELKLTEEYKKNGKSPQ